VSHLDRWSHAIHGPQALLSAPSSRPPVRALSPQQQQLIPEFLWHGAEAYGFRGSVWTCGRIAKVIEEEFGVTLRQRACFASAAAPELDAAELPIRRASQRNEQANRAVGRGRESLARGCLLKRKGAAGRLFLWMSGVYLLPSVVKTYAPRALTPVLRGETDADHLSAMGGMTPAGRIYTLARQTSLNGSQVVSSWSI